MIGRSERLRPEGRIPIRLGTVLFPVIAEAPSVNSEIAERGGQRQTPRSQGDDGGETLDDLLSDPHCRHLVEYLRDREGPVDVGTLAAHVVARVRGVPVEAIEPDVRRRVQTWLHHGQLPALSAHGVVEYDVETGTVRLVGGR